MTADFKQNTAEWLGPMPGTPDWSVQRSRRITASNFARALGQSEYGQPLDVYLEVCGLSPPFEGNDYTDRGNRFEPFIAGEYAAQTGIALERPLPLVIHPEHDFLAATPDARHVADTRHGVEFKACSFRRAAALGESKSDDIFDEWLLQAHGQMLVCGFDIVTVFVMVDLHTYRTFQVERNQAVLDAMLPPLQELWRRIVERDPPPINFSQPGCKALVQKLHKGVTDEVVPLDDEAMLMWDRLQECRESEAFYSSEAETIRAQLLDRIGTAKAGRLPDGLREIGRTIVAESLYTAADAEAITAKVGQVKRKGYVTLRERKVKL